MANLHLLLSALSVYFLFESFEGRSLPSFIALLEEESKLMDPLQSYLSSGILLSLRQSENSQEAIAEQPSMHLDEPYESSGDGPTSSLMDSVNTVNNVQASKDQRKGSALSEKLKESLINKLSVPLDSSFESSGEGESFGYWESSEEEESSGDVESPGYGESSSYVRTSGYVESSGDGGSSGNEESSGILESSGDEESSGDGEYSEDWESSVDGASSGDWESSGVGESSGNAESSGDGEESSGEGESFGSGKLRAFLNLRKLEESQNLEKNIALLSKLRQLIVDSSSMSLKDDLKSSGDGESKPSSESLNKENHPQSHQDKTEDVAILENLPKIHFNESIKSLNVPHKSSGDGQSTLFLFNLNTAGYGKSSQDKPKGFAEQYNLKKSIFQEPSIPLDGDYEYSGDKEKRPSFHSLNNIQDNQSSKDQAEKINNSGKLIFNKLPMPLEESSDDGELRSSLDFIDTSDNAQVSRDLQEPFAISESSAEDLSYEDSKRSYNEADEYVYSDESESYPSLFRNSNN